MSSFPKRFTAALIPDAAEALASNAIFNTGTLKHVLGYKAWIIEVQHAGITRIVFLPSAFSTIRNAKLAGQPGHAADPGNIISSFGKSFIAI
jgi:hypothetical protein